MRLVFSFVLVLGLGLAGFAVYMAKDYIGAYQAELANERAARAQMVPTKDVYVANRVLAYGEVLTKEDVTVIKWPENALPEGIFHTEEELFPNENKDARIILRKMEKNEPVLAVKITAPGEDAGVSSRLAAGMRAFAIRVDVSTGVSGFLRPGDYVDVYWTGRAFNGESTGDVTKLIQASIQIIAVDQQADGENTSPSIARTVTVTVSPSQVAALAQAQSSGRLSLSLVGVNEENKAADVEINQQQLLGIADSEVPAPVEVARVCTIKTRKGAETVETPIPCTN
ncbi:MAG: Flp pilus assembly protein CpaB [Paracoccaceae bacterium]